MVIGASAGGLAALSVVLGALPNPFPVAIAIVLHLSPDHHSFLPQVLTRSARRAVTWGGDESPLLPGAIYVAPPDRHLLVDRRGHTSLAASARVHFARPSVDRLFISAAGAFGDRTLAVVLTGTGFDGRDGAVAVRRAGGVVIAQDEASSEYFSMPRGAIEADAVSVVLPLDAIPVAVARLVTTGNGNSQAVVVTPPEPPRPGRARLNGSRRS